ncbi:hypothetical protein ACFL2Q_17435 [Thermodesulfobacteriota bacterium]
MMQEPIPIKTERLAYWYFRLNGCATIENFIVHPEEGSAQETEVDIIAIRFPFRAERLTNPMLDDEQVFPLDHRIKILLVEVKESRCGLNKSWRAPERRNMERLVKAIGPFPEDMLKPVAHELYATGSYKDSVFLMRLVCVGKEINLGIANERKGVLQLTWTQILDFICHRIKSYPAQKRSHQQWCHDGAYLYEQARLSTDGSELGRRIGLFEKLGPPSA